MKNLHSNAGKQETAKRIAAYYSTTELKTLCHNLFSVSADLSNGAIERMMAKISFLFYPENSMELTQHILMHLEMNHVDQIMRDMINENINLNLSSRKSHERFVWVAGVGEYKDEKISKCPNCYTQISNNVNYCSRSCADIYCS
tara:strand:- start:113 stop:544 length:432 start_codon:yes stop_codon:yes gene_type:complete